MKSTRCAPSSTVVALVGIGRPVALTHQRHRAHAQQIFGVVVAGIMSGAITTRPETTPA
jgi:hypothetical protein